MMNWYTKVLMMVRWDNCYATLLRVMSGVELDRVVCYHQFFLMLLQCYCRLVRKSCTSVCVI